MLECESGLLTYTKFYPPTDLHKISIVKKPVLIHIKFGMVTTNGVQLGIALTRLKPLMRFMTNSPHSDIDNKQVKVCRKSHPCHNEYRACKRKHLVMVWSGGLHNQRRPQIEVVYTANAMSHHNWLSIMTIMKSMINLVGKRAEPLQWWDANNRIKGD